MLRYALFSAAILSVIGCGKKPGDDFDTSGAKPTPATTPAPAPATPAKKDAPAPSPGLTGEQKAAAGAALKALGKVEAVAQAGTTLARYSELVGDAKALANEAERELPASELKAHLSAAMRAYVDANTVWASKISDPSRGLSAEWGDGEIIAHYKVPLNDLKIGNKDVALQLIWAAASKKLSAAREAIKTN